MVKARIDADEGGVKRTWIRKVVWLTGASMQGKIA